MPERSRHERNSLLDTVEHHIRRHPQDAIPEPAKVPVPPRVGARTARVIAAVDLDDEPHRRRAEVSDVAAHDNLPPKGNAEPTAAQLLPKQRLRGGRRAPHGGSAMSEDEMAGLRHGTSEARRWPGFEASMAQAP